MTTHPTPRAPVAPAQSPAATAIHPDPLHDLPDPAAAHDLADELTILMDKRIDTALAAAIAVVGALAVWIATGFRIGNFPDPLTSRGLPYILGGCMIAGGLVLALRRLRGWNDLPGNFVVSEGMEDEPGHPASARVAFMNVAIAFGWALLLRPVGFLIVTPLACAAMIALLGERGVAKLVIFPLGFTLLLWVTFSQILSLNLPLGPLNPLARSLGLML